MLNRSVLTLEEFRKQELRQLNNPTGELSNLFRDIALAAKRINIEVNKAGLVDIIGATGLDNIQGESVQKLDVYANQQFIAVLERGVSCAGVASEELDDFIAFKDVLCKQSKYVCVFDPLDGSSNIDVNMPIGTIFAVYRRLSPLGGECVEDDFLQPGHNIIAAGYILYGTSTMLVFATRRGVNGFTLDPAMGEFTLSHANIKCPEEGNIYSVNHGNYFQYDGASQYYIQKCQLKKDGHGGPYTERYIGSMVADCHRNLLRGGIFLYPGTAKNPAGILRLVYECNPFAFIYEMAGGLAMAGHQRVLDLTPQQLHQRIPFVAGSKSMVEEWQQLIK